MNYALKEGKIIRKKLSDGTTDMPVGSIKKGNNPDFGRPDIGFCTG